MIIYQIISVKYRCEETGKIILLKNDIAFNQNNEMLILNNLYELLNTSLIIKDIIKNDNNLRINNLDLNLLIEKIKDKNIKGICNSLFGILHFNNNLFNLSENEFQLTINFIKEIEKQLRIEGKYEDNKIKDEIKRSSNVLYLNEFSKFNNIDEYMQDIIYLNIYKQRFIYFYAMTKYKLANSINKENNDYVSRINKSNNKRDKQKRDDYLYEAIKYFNECKKINELFGINQIKIIYSLIMSSKCYLNLKDYKNSIIKINEALNLYFDFSKTFNDYHSIKYNPKVMLFVETNIFHHILFTISNICSVFNKTSANNWIILKIFETSPFIISNVHYISGYNLINFLQKNKTNMNRYDKNFLQNKILMNKYDGLQKYYIKISSRLFEKNIKDKNTKNISKKSGENYNKKSINYRTIKENTMSFKLSSSLNASQDRSLYYLKNKRLKKNITICFNENILEIIKWEEFKNVIIKYLNKYFKVNEDDKFGFVQFGINGLIIKSILFRTLNHFISILNTMKNNIALVYNLKNSKNSNGLYDIFVSIINSYPKSDENDNVIMLFIDEKDIKFSSISDC